MQIIVGYRTARHSKFTLLKALMAFAKINIRKHALVSNILNNDTTRRVKLGGSYYVLKLRCCFSGYFIAVQNISSIVCATKRIDKVCSIYRRLACCCRYLLTSFDDTVQFCMRQQRHTQCCIGVHSTVD